mgnify:CR=1 FL=1
MGGGGGGSRTPTEQKVVSTDLPDYVQPYFERLLKRGEAESLQPRYQYGGDRLAYFSPDELTAQAMTRGFAQAGTPPELQEATRSIGGLQTDYSSGYRAPSLTGIPGPSPRGAGMTDMPSQQTPGNTGVAGGMVFQGGGGGPMGGAEFRGGQPFMPSLLDDGASQMVEPSPTGQLSTPYIPDFQKLSFEEGIDRFMSPFQQQVTDIAKREARRGSEIEGERIAQQAAQAGGLGGYREAILQAERERNLGQRLDDIQTKGSQQAFDTAMRQLGAERAADLSGAQFGLSRLGQLEGARQAEERLRQAGFDLSGRLGLARGQSLLNLGQATQADTLARLNALRQQGAQQRALQQASLDMGYQDFLRQQDATRGQLGFLAQLLRGVPVQPEQTISTFQQQPGLFQSLIGTGLGGLGLYRGMS